MVLGLGSRQAAARHHRVRMMFGVGGLMLVALAGPAQVMAEAGHAGGAPVVRFGGITLMPMLAADSVLYTDSEGGRGDRHFGEALGIFNVHSHADGSDGHAHSHELDKGFNFRGVELGLGVTIDNLAEGRLRMHGTEDAAELEEAWLATVGLPLGLQVKGGRFLSAFNTENERHPHEWDFVTPTLAYRMLLGGEVRGDGVQVGAAGAVMPGLSLAAGFEAFDTDNEAIAGRVGAAEKAAIGAPRARFAEDPSWPDVWTLYGRATVALGAQHEVTFAAARIQSRLHQELHRYHPGVNDANHGLEGETTTDSVSARYDFHSGEAAGVGDFALYAEYLIQDKPVDLTFHQLKPGLVGQPRDLKVNAFYVAALYGFAPGWTLGARYDIAGALHEASRARASVGPTHTSEFEDLWRVSGNVTWDINAHNRLRLEASHGEVMVPLDTNGDGRSEAVAKDVNAIMLQYVLRFGGHSHGHDGH